MGLLKTAATAVSAVGTVGKTVLGIVGGLGKIGAGVLKSKIGKFALGAGALAILSSNPSGEKGGSLLSKAAETFKSFIGGIGATVADKAGTAALGATAAVTGAGKAVSEAVEAVENDTSRLPGLEHAIATGSFDGPVRQEETAPAVAGHEPSAPDAGQLEYEPA